MPNDVDMMSQIAGQGGGPGAGPMGPGAGPGAQAGPGGPAGPLGGPNKVDTPQEQKALQMLMQGSLMFREAANLDPSVRYIIDKVLMDAYGQVTKHYGLEQEGKLALQQAQLMKQREMQQKFSGPGGPGAGPQQQPQPPVAPPGPPVV